MLRAWSIIKRLQGRTLQSPEGGFSPVEVLLAASLFALFSVALVGALVYGRASTASAGDRARAAALTEEGIEATRNIKNAAYSNLVDGTYGLAKSGGVWIFSGSSDVTGGYTRQVTIATVDSVRKSITVTVTWTRGTVSRTVTAYSRLANWTTSLISWPNAALSGSFDATSNDNGFKVATSGNFAYLVRNTGSATNFLIVNITNTAAPTLASSLTLAGIPTNVTINGNFAYVANSGNSTELQIINVTNPAAPVLAGTFNAAGNTDGTAVALNGNFAYLTRSGGGLVAVNVTNPAAPTLTSTFSGSASYFDITISGTLAYVANGDNSAELQIVDIANPASLVSAGTFNAAGNNDATAITKHNNTVFLARGTEILSLNVTTPASVSQLGTMALSGSGNANSLAIESTGAYLFVGSSNNTAEFRIASVATPASMSVVRTIDVAGSSSNVNGVAFSASKTAALAASDSNTQELLIYVQN